MLQIVYQFNSFLFELWREKFLCRLHWIILFKNLFLKFLFELEIKKYLIEYFNFSMMTAKVKGRMVFSIFCFLRSFDKNIDIYWFIFGKESLFHFSKNKDMNRPAYFSKNYFKNYHPRKNIKIN